MGSATADTREWVETFDVAPGTIPKDTDVPRAVAPSVLGVEERVLVPPGAAAVAAGTRWEVRWSSKDAAIHERDALLRWAGLAAGTAPSSAAWARPVCRPKPTWWERATARVPRLGRLIATFVVISGTAYAFLAALEKHHARLLEGPVVRLAHSEAPIDALLGVPLRVPFRIRNGSSNPDSRVAFSVTRVKASSASEVGLAPDDRDSDILGAGEAHDVVVDLRPRAAGPCEVTLVCRARGGLLRGARTESFRRSVRVWKPLEIQRVPLDVPDTDPSTRSVVATFVVRVGAAIDPTVHPGAQLRVGLDGVPPDVRGQAVYTRLAGAGGWGRPSAPGSNGLVHLVYAAALRPVDAFREERVDVTVVGDARPVSKWSQVLSAASVAIDD